MLTELTGKEAVDRAKHEIQKLVDLGVCLQCATYIVGDKLDVHCGKLYALWVNQELPHG